MCIHTHIHTSFLLSCQNTKVTCSLQHWFLTMFESFPLRISYTYIPRKTYTHIHKHTCTYKVLHINSEVQNPSETTYRDPDHNALLFNTVHSTGLCT